MRNGVKWCKVVELAEFHAWGVEFELKNGGGGADVSRHP